MRGSLARVVSVLVLVGSIAGQSVTRVAAAPRPAQSATTTTYIVVAGDYLYGIARKTGTPFSALLSLNGLTATSVIRPGQVLVVHVTTPPTSTSTPTTPPTSPSTDPPWTSRETTTYRVVKGDTLYGIASKTATPINDLLGLNGLTLRSVILPGQILIIFVAPSNPSTTSSSTTTSTSDPTTSTSDPTTTSIDDGTTSSSTSPTTSTTPPMPTQATYTVRAGDSLYGIAAKTGTPINTLLSLNGLTITSVIHPGQVLIVLGATATTSTTAATVPPDNEVSTSALAGTPGAPHSVSASPQPGGVTLRWSAPDDPGESDVVDYVIEFRTAAKAAWTVHPDSTSTSTTAVISGLAGGVAHVFRVRALNAAGGGTPSMAVAAVPALTPTCPVSANGVNLKPFTAVVTDSAAARCAPTNAASGATRFGVASVSKMVTALTVLRLADAGSIHLDRPFMSQLPAAMFRSPVDARWKQITVRQLLNHTSGIPKAWNWFFNQTAALAAGGDWRRIAAQAPSIALQSTPGTKYQYSNVNYVLVGMIIEHAAGESIVSAAERLVFAPLGLDASTHRLTSDQAAEAVDNRHTNYAQWKYNALGPAGAFFLTPQAAARLPEAFRELLSPAMYSRAVAGSAANPAYGLGLMRIAPGVYGHTGSIGGVSTAVGFSPARGLTAAVLYNGTAFASGSDLIPTVQRLLQMF